MLNTWDRLNARNKQAQKSKRINKEPKAYIHTEGPTTSNIRVVAKDELDQLDHNWGPFLTRHKQAQRSEPAAGRIITKLNYAELEKRVLAHHMFGEEIITPGGVKIHRMEAGGYNSLLSAFKFGCYYG